MKKKYNVINIRPVLSKEELEKRKQEILLKIYFALNAENNHNDNKG